MPRQRRQAGDTRPCCRCGTEFVLTEAQARGSEGRCKACKAADNRRFLSTHQEHRREYARKYRKANPEKIAKWSAAARATPEFKAKWAQYVAENSEKIGARAKAQAAVRRGKLVRQPCMLCGSTNMVEAHHHDYSKPLDVEWLCRRCHRLHHPTPNN